MNTATGKHPTSGDVASRLAFFKTLQTVTTRIHATHNIDEIIFELSNGIFANSSVPSD